MRTSKQILEAFGRAMARTPSLYWMVPIPPSAYRRTSTLREQGPRS